MSEIATGTIAAIATAVVPQQGSVGIARVSRAEAMLIACALPCAPGRQPSGNLPDTPMVTLWLPQTQLGGRCC